MKTLYNKRKVYNKSELHESDLTENPIDMFSKWLKEAQDCPEIIEANAMNIATLDPDGCPHSRMVLLKAFSEEGFIFYTNYESQKGQAIISHPMACLHFFWPPLERQVIIKAHMEKTSAEDSDHYFHARPHSSQLGALASHQSTIIPDADYLQNRLHELEKEYEGKEIPRPDYWGGFLARPYEIEFWQGRPSRLHDRLRYEKKTADFWEICRLSS